MVQMEHCSCQRRITTTVTPPSIALNMTTCSSDSFARGMNQRVIGFSIYGNEKSESVRVKGYFAGIKGNLDLMEKYYPGWTMRLYFDLPPESGMMKTLCKYACDNPTLDLCHAGKLPGRPMKDATKVFAMIWRFFPTMDPQVQTVSTANVQTTDGLKL